MIPGETHVIVLHLPAGRLPAFRGRGWVAVEAVADEQAARARFHALKPAMNGLQAAAVLLRGIVNPDKTVEGTRTLISKDAEFWRLKGTEIRFASREQVEEWMAAVVDLIARDEAQAAARRPGKRRPTPTSLPPRAVLAACVAVVVVLMAAIVSWGYGDRTADAARSASYFQSDTRDPNMVIEYLVAEDGSRRVLRRLTREELQSGAAANPEHANATAKLKTLADGINAFFRVRQ